MRALDIAGTGMQAQQTNVEVISNNPHASHNPMKTLDFWSFHDRAEIS
jgi:flagellar basal body rod protein FlgC